ncbi:MAG: SCP2 sterol-binding domain-containing protein [Caldilineaceae bacterium]
MAYKFPSQAWADEFMVKINTSDAYASAAKTWEGDLFLVIEESGALYLDLWHGECRQALYTTDLASKKPEFKITANMEKWKKVLAGKLDPVQGMITRQIKLDGNLVKIMKNVKAAQELVRCATHVETEY